MNPYGATERAIVRLGRTARGIMGDIASQRVKAGQTELAREKMRYDISALQGKHKVEIAQIKATHKHREGVRGIQSTRMENEKNYQDKMLKLNRDRFDAEKGTLMTAEEAAGILYAGLPDQQAAASQIIGGMSDKMRGIKLPGKEWAGIIGEIRGAQRKTLEHKQRGRILDIQEKTAETKLIEAKRGDKITVSKVLPSGRVATKKVYPDKIPEGWAPYDRKGAVTKPEVTESDAIKENEKTLKALNSMKDADVLTAFLIKMNPKVTEKLGLSEGDSITEEIRKTYIQAATAKIQYFNQFIKDKKFKPDLGERTEPTKSNITHQFDLRKGMVPVE